MHARAQALAGAQEDAVETNAWTQAQAGVQEDEEGVQGVMLHAWAGVHGTALHACADAVALAA
eukprot:901028-Pelagomonas_calceolata.AAC.1